jgi:hypothetical protein
VLTLPGVISVTRTPGVSRASIGRLEQRADGRAATHIGWHEQRLDAEYFAFQLDGGDRGRRPGSQHHIPALIAESAGGGPANPTGGASDDHDPPAGDFVDRQAGHRSSS